MLQILSILYKPKIHQKLLSNCGKLLDQVLQIYSKKTVLLESKANKAVLKDSKGFTSERVETAYAETACRDSMQRQNAETSMENMVTKDSNNFEREKI